MKTRGVAVSFLILALGGMLFWQWQTIRELRVEARAAESAVAERDQLLAENARLAAREDASEELATLRKGHGELVRLRGETARLRQQLNNQRVAPVPAPQTPVPPTRTEPVETLTAHAEQDLKPGETLVAGSWARPGNKTLFLLVEPTPISATGSATALSTAGAQILFNTQFLLLDNSVAAKVGLGAPTITSVESTSHSVMKAAELREFLRGLPENERGEGLAAPRMTTANGLPAEVSLMDDKVIDGKTYSIGSVVGLVGTIAPDGQTIRVTVEAKSAQESAQ